MQSDPRAPDQFGPPPPQHPGAYYGGPPQFGYGAPQKPTNTVLKIFAVLGVIVLMGFGGCVGLFVWAASGHEGGVRAGNQMEPYALDYINAHALLNDTEEIVAYYDVTIEYDASESAILTTERLIYDRDGRTTSMDLEDIVDVSSQDAGISGVVIDAEAKDGSRIRVEVAALNGGEIFERDLRTAVERARLKSNPEE